MFGILYQCSLCGNRQGGIADEDAPYPSPLHNEVRDCARFNCHMRHHISRATQWDLVDEPNPILGGLFVPVADPDFKALARATADGLAVWRQAVFAYRMLAVAAAHTKAVVTRTSADRITTITHRKPQ